ncbi:SRPBCC family protein [Microbacterium sp. ASV81]|uniref:SRPBCC family protein n=1 Tax=Microbacterium capsulatum TaxID=3041921 RepID=A0ABU0XI76_9MICO|nr:SRPBCC family protein [Microbacterium sp. ASV81]MDQ4213395.1 SRPBCC family protein [Microbacterium sp. ASV81]
MPIASRTIEIAAPVETVFAFFTDPANDRKWRGGVKEIQAQGAPGVGATVHQVIAGPGGRSIDADIRITEYTAPTRYAFAAIAGPVRPVGSYTFEETPGGTQVTFDLSAEVTGLKKLFMGGPVQKNMDGEMAALDKAKALLEA